MGYMAGETVTPETLAWMTTRPSLVHLGSDRWQDQAHCAGSDVSVFFPGQGQSTAPAKQVCAGCPVRSECFEFAMANHLHYGVWGGVSEKERRNLRRQRRTRAAA